MKRTILGLAIITIAFTACNTLGNSGSATEKNNSAAGNVSANTSNIKPNAKVSVKGIVDAYLHLKNALASDNGNDAATAGNEILNAMSKMNTNAMNAAQKKAYAAIADDTKENAEHISANAGKIEHQREHFEMLSKDIADMITTFGNGGQTLYTDFCPMYNDGKGAIWISEIKDIKNPYLGKKMLTCGTMKNEMK